MISNDSENETFTITICCPRHKPSVGMNKTSLVANPGSLILIIGILYLHTIEDERGAIGFENPQFSDKSVRRKRRGVGDEWWGISGKPRKSLSSPKHTHSVVDRVNVLRTTLQLLL